MKCKECGCSIKDRMLYRTNPKGQSDAGWMCIFCIEKTEPELAKNIKGDADYKVVADIEAAIRRLKPLPSPDEK